MKFRDLFRYSTDNLRRRKGRTVLTIIGVVVGVCAIVVMMSLGIAVNKATDEMMSNWGDLTRIEVSGYGATQEAPALDDAMVNNFKGIDHVLAATPLYQSGNLSGTIVAGRNGKFQTWPMIVGVDSDALQPMGYELSTGSFDIGTNMGRTRIPVLVGDQFIFNFYDSTKSWRNPNYQKYPEYNDDYTQILNLPQFDAEGNLLNPGDFLFDFTNTTIIYRMTYGYDEQGNEKYREYELVIVGVVKSSWSDYMIGQGVIMDIEQVHALEAEYKKLSGNSGSGGGGMMMSYGGAIQSRNAQSYDSVYIKVDDVKNMPAVEKQLKEYGYQIYSMSEQRAQLQAQALQGQLMLGGLAAVSLFVAALNIANTMTMAIYERTKEIGVMKVLGCRLGNIREMFLIESGAIGFLGGVVGVVLSLLLSLLLNNLTTWLAMLGIDSKIDIASLFGLGGMSEMMQGMQLSIIPAWLVLMALVFATLVGLLSGIAPANRAMRISSLEAIRHE